MGEWAALDASADRPALASQLARAHERMVTERRWPVDDPSVAAVRPVIARSWERSLAAGLDPGVDADPQREARLQLTPAEVEARRAHHPLATATPVLTRMLDDAGDGHHCGTVCDADGSILWLLGADPVIDWATSRSGEMVGCVTAESVIGTNAVGTAIVERHGLQVFGAEHFGPGGHVWCCSAAPVFDPLTWQLLGVVGLNAPIEAAHPHSLVLAAMAAREIQRELLAGAQAVATTLLHPPDATVTVLGRERGVLQVAGKRVELSRRHTEFLMLLIACPEGLTAEQLAIEAYGERGRPGSVRTEMHRLRLQLGPLMSERPYRVSGRIDTDISIVEGHVREGRLAAALDRYPGPALPGTTAPRLVELRDRLDDELRAAVIASGDQVLLRRWLQTPSGEGDVEAARRLGAD